MNGDNNTAFSKQHITKPTNGFIAGFLVAVVVVIQGCASGPLHTPKTNPYIDGDQIFYRGHLDRKHIEQVIALYEQADNKPTTLNIDSTGGLVELGLDLGEWILDNDLDVYIPNFCVSSCANYVFTAGRRVVLGENALVAWHGSPIADDILQGTEDGKTRRAMVLEDLKKEKLGGTNPRRYWRKIRTRNRRFFREAGVSPLITVPFYLANEATKEEIRRAGHFSKFAISCSLADLKVFGMDNVTIENNAEWKPESNKRYGDWVIQLQLAENYEAFMHELHNKISKTP